MAKALPTYLEGEQLSLLATDTEWLPENPNISGTPRDEGSVADLIEEKVGVKYYRIRKARDKATIKRSKHVKDDSGRGTLEEF